MAVGYVDVLEPLSEAARAAVVRRVVRSERWALMSVLWSWSSQKRVRACCRRRISAMGVIEIGTADGVASVRNLQRCASVWDCPVCAPKIRNGRAQEIREGVEEHLRRGGGVVFVTLTLPHDQGDELRPLWDAVAGTWSDIADSDWWHWFGGLYGLDITTERKRKDGTVTRSTRRKLGVVRALDLTHGFRFGWHPHLHNLVLTDRPLGGAELGHFTAQLFDGWCAGVQAAGFRTPTIAHGMKVERVTSAEDLAGYLAGVDGTKIDLELARPDLKRARGVNRTPWQVLRDVRSGGDRRDLEVWWEYERASKGRNAVTWSHGLKRHLGVGEATDDDLAAESVGHRTMWELSGAAWGRVVEARLVAPLLSAVESFDRSEVLDVLELAGVDLVDVRWVPPDG